MNLETVQANELAALVVAETLAHRGIRDVVVSPGSRSTPLTAVFAKDGRFDVNVILDERSAAFFALGRAKSSGRASVLVCTSGSATANYLPAIVEARYSHTPLLVLTADRPLMGQHCHSGQTIDQIGMFANFVNHQQQLELPRASAAGVRYLRETLRHALYLTKFPQGGVVHLNVPYEDPLTPALSAEALSDCRQTLRETYFAGEPGRSLDQAGVSGSPLQGRDCSTQGGEAVAAGWMAPLLCILGPDYADGQQEGTLSLLHCLQGAHIPVLVDALHPARGLSGQFSNLITCYEAMLQPQMELQPALGPRTLLQLGNLPTSKSLRQALESWDCERWIVGGAPLCDHQDPTYSRTAGFMNLQQLCTGLSGVSCEVAPAQASYLQRWQVTRDAVQASIDDALKALPGWTESRLCRSLADWIEVPCDLFVANSMIIRDMEQYYPGSPLVRRVFSNRGANGIDGIISTAIGTASRERPMLCLIGDLSFLHEAGGLNQSRNLRHGERMLLVVLDNAGGGIFEHLPIASQGELFETYFATPQPVNLAAICEAYGVRYTCADSDLQAEDCIRSFLDGRTPAFAPGSPVSVLHLHFDRKASASGRRSVIQAVKHCIQTNQRSS
jgi:2-succinyl-5-enolpyruvyl-6-hydroxy-3-cyclohexene-1-carboxylate synthase